MRQMARILYFKEFDDPSTNNGLAENKDGQKFNGLFLNLNYKDLNLTALTIKL